VGGGGSGGRNIYGRHQQQQQQQQQMRTVSGSGFVVMNSTSTANNTTIMYDIQEAVSTIPRLLDPTNPYKMYAMSPLQVSLYRGSSMSLSTVNPAADAAAFMNLPVLVQIKASVDDGKGQGSNNHSNVNIPMLQLCLDAVSFRHPVLRSVAVGGSAASNGGHGGGGYIGKKSRSETAGGGGIPSGFKVDWERGRHVPLETVVLAQDLEVWKGAVDAVDVMDGGGGGGAGDGILVDDDDGRNRRADSVLKSVRSAMYSKPFGVHHSYSYNHLNGKQRGSSNQMNDTEFPWRCVVFTSVTNPRVWVVGFVFHAAFVDILSARKVVAEVMELYVAASQDPVGKGTELAEMMMTMKGVVNCTGDGDAERDGQDDNDGVVVGGQMSGLSFVDVAGWLQVWASSSALRARELEYWEWKFGVNVENGAGGGFLVQPRPLSLPYNQLNGPFVSFGGGATGIRERGQVSMELGPGLGARVRVLASGIGRLGRVEDVFLAGLVALLLRYEASSGRGDVVVGVVDSGRGRHQQSLGGVEVDLRDVVGRFENVLPVRVQWENGNGGGFGGGASEVSFDGLLSVVQRTMVEVLENSDIPAGVIQSIVGEGVSLNQVSLSLFFFRIFHGVKILILEFLSLPTLGYFCLPPSGSRRISVIQSFHF
jgi:hypothetical protein